MEKSIVLKIGGSLLYTDGLHLDKQFLTKLVRWYDQAKKDYQQVIIVIGGGKMSRFLVDELEGFNVTTDNKHRVGMHVTQTNAQILLGILNTDQDRIPPTLGHTLERVIGDRSSTIVGGGFKEGWSTDMNAAVIASVINAKKVYKISNIDYIYTADPNKDPEARPLKNLTWTQYFDQFGIVPGKEDAPGLHTPIGTHASLFCAQKGISFFLTGGEMLKQKEIGEILEAGSFVHP